MKHLFSILSLAAAAFAFTACGGDEPEPNPDNGGGSNTEKPAYKYDISQYKKIDYQVRDLALIYQGGSHRIDWTAEEFAPYVSHRFINGEREWLFDGFLFLEFTSGPGGRQFTAGYGQANATKADWEWYLNRLFEKGKSLDALNKRIEQDKASLGEPPFKHKVALTAFVPIQGQEDWGEIDGVALNFRKEADRATAGKWFVDQLISRFEAGNYNNLDLYGIYMICEEASTIQTYCRNLKEHCASKNLDFLWIPYFNASGAGSWKSWGFDIAYQQPNHFFSEATPDSRLDAAINFAKQNNMGLEFECDEKALSQANPCFDYRMKAYMDYFEKHGVWYDTPVAYYTGNHLFLDFQRNPSIQNNLLFDRICRYIVNRQYKALED